MKRFLSLLLCAAILVAVPIHFGEKAEAATDPYKIIVQYGDSDVANGKVNDTYNYYGLTADTSANAQLASSNSTYTKISKYSAQMGPLVAGNSGNGANYFNIENIGYNLGRTDTDKVGTYSHINFSIYSTAAITIRAHLTDSADQTRPSSDGTSGGFMSLAPGWNRITMSINDTTAGGLWGPRLTGSLNRISLNVASGTTIPDGFTNSGSRMNEQSGLAGAMIYLDAVYMSNGAVPNNVFEAITVKEGADKVLTTTQTLKFKAPGLIESSLNASNVTVKYCLEGTHDEANHSQATLNAGTDFTLGYEANTLKLNFANALVAGTTYNIRISGAGFRGDLALPFDIYELSFRTLGAGENIPPEVSLVDLVANTRFFPADGAITLKATASDINGTIEKVEFYADENLLGEVTTPTEGVYTYTWENPTEDAAGYDITAKAYDDQGDATETDPIPVLVLDLKNPEVTLTAPTENVVISRNFAGIASSSSVTVEADVNCIGSTPSEVEFVVDGDTVHAATNTASTYTHTLTDLDLGTHSVYVRVTDEYDMQGVSESVTVTVRDFGRAVPGVLEEDFETYAEGEAIDWTLSGEAVTLTAGDYIGNTVAKLATENASADETVYTQKRYRTSLSATPWEASVRVNLPDMAFDRTVELMGASEGLVLTFKTDGGVYVGSTKEADYKTGEWYDVKIVVDPAAKTLNALLDDTVILTKTALSAAYSQSGATIKVSQNVASGKSGSVLIDDVGVYKISETQAEATGITVYDGTAPAADLDTVPVSADRLTVSLNEAMGGSLKNNVWVIDTAENRKLALSFDDTTVYFGEELRGNREYKVVVTTGVSGVSGQAIAKSGVFTFTTAPKDGEIADATFSVSELSESVSSVTCDLDFINHSGTEHTMQVVAVVYDGNAMQNIMIQPVTVSASTPSDTLSVTVPIDSYNANVRVEVFVVDNLASMTPISETIYTIK